MTLARGWTREIAIGLRSTLDAIYDNDVTFEDGRDQIVARLREDPDYDPNAMAVYGTRQAVFTDIVDDDLANADNGAALDLALEALYDWADDNRVWISPLGGQS